MNHHPLHTNDWFAEQSVQGRNVVVGNLVYSLVLGMSVPDVSGAAIANLEVETLQHKFPTFHGDTIHAETRVLDVQESKSKNDRGIVTVESKGFNQDGKEVCYFRRRVMVWKRDVAPAASPPVRRRRRLGLSSRSTGQQRRPSSRWGHAAAARPAVAAHPRPVGDPRQRGDAAADAGATGSIPKWLDVPRRVPDRRRRAPPRRSATCCGCGRASAIRGGRATCTPRPRRGHRARRRSRDTLDGLLALPGVGPYTARACSRSRSRSTPRWSTPTSPACYARVAGRRLTPREVQAVADAALPPGERVGVEPVPSWTSARCCAGRRDPACGECPLRASTARGAASATTRPSARPASAREQARFEGSDRQGRGRLMQALGVGPVAAADLDAAMGWPRRARARRARRRRLVVDATASPTFDGTPLTACPH